MDNQLLSYWSATLEILEKEFSSVIYNNYIKELKPLYIENGVLVLRTVDHFHKMMIHNRYLKTMDAGLKAATKKDWRIEIVIDEEKPLSGNRSRATFQTNLKSQYVFETFVRGKSNELAYAASVSVADAPGKTRFNPLFLYGGSGLGKTHLLHSIGNYIMEKEPETRVLYVSSETFTNEMINSIKENKNQEFRNKYRENDVLLIDDIQFIAEKESTQEEFFHTFNTLYDANKQIVISSDQPPKDMKTLQDRLSSRFGSGLIIDLTLPDYETRVAILAKKSELDNLVIPNEIIQFIAKNIVSNVRDLEGALTKISAYFKLSHTEVNMNLAENILKEFISEKEKTEITVEFIQEIVSNYYNVSSEDIRGKKRTQNIVFPRQVAMYLSHKTLGISLPKLGQQFGGRDHSTVIHSCNKISAEMESSQSLRDTLIDLEKKIRGE